MPRRKIRDAADADAELAAARAAGLTNRAWAARNGICGRSLHLWSVHRGRAASAPQAGQRFIELVPLPNREIVPAPPPRSEGCPPIRLSVAGVAIEVTAGFDPETLGKVLHVVRSC